METNPSAYVDTSALIAFLDRSDKHHQLFLRLFSDPPPLLTSVLVISEGHGWFLRKYNQHKAAQFLEMVSLMSPLKIVSVSEVDLARSGSLANTYSDQELTLADAFGLHLMEREKIAMCWSTDRHLGLTGVPLVIHST